MPGCRPEPVGPRGRLCVGYAAEGEDRPALHIEADASQGALLQLYRLRRRQWQYGGQGQHGQRETLDPRHGREGSGQHLSS